MEYTRSTLDSLNNKLMSNSKAVFKDGFIHTKRSDILVTKIRFDGFDLDHPITEDYLDALQIFIERSDERLYPDAGKSRAPQTDLLNGVLNEMVNEIVEKRNEIINRISGLSKPNQVIADLDVLSQSITAMSKLTYKTDGLSMRGREVSVAGRIENIAQAIERDKQIIPGYIEKKSHALDEYNIKKSEFNRKGAFGKAMFRLTGKARQMNKARSEAMNNGLKEHSRDELTNNVKADYVRYFTNNEDLLRELENPNNNLSWNESVTPVSKDFWGDYNEEESRGRGRR